MNILFIGDIIGNSGVKKVVEILPSLKKERRKLCRRSSKSIKIIYTIK